MKKLFLIGGGGHCRSCIDVIEADRKFQIKGIFDIAERVGETVFDYPILGTDETVEKSIAPNHFFLITLGQIKSAGPRKAIYARLKNAGAEFATIVSPRAWVSPHAKVGAGTIIMHDALVNAGALVGENCILNAKSLIEHDAQIGGHSHISTSAVVNGDCIVGPESFVGSNCVLEQGFECPASSVLQAGQFHRMMNNA